MSRHALGLVFALAGLLSAAPIGAQDVLRGVVRDATGAPLPDTEVTLFGLRVPTAVVRTDATGAFAFDSVPRGDFWLHARRIGSQPARQSITVEHRRTPREVVFELQPIPPVLDAVVATAAIGHDFARDARAWGRLITRDRIERSRAPRLSALLQQYIPGLPFDAAEMHRALHANEANDAAMRLVGVHVDHPTVTTSKSMLSLAGGVAGNQFPLAAFTVARGVRAPCVPAFSINGGYPVLGLDPDAIPIEQVEAVEFFRAGAGTPIALQFQQPQDACGMVRLWLRNHAL